jgi:peptidyl-prolyl cis-trans isomerase A (cyclophilin A)
MSHLKSAAICLAAVPALIWIAGAQSTTAEKKPAAKAPAAVPAKNFKVHFDTTKGAFDVEVHRDWAPKGADHFYKLVTSGFYDGARFFRVVPGFVVQFGLAANPADTQKWNAPITDDPVKQSNGPGYLVYATAGANTRTTQLFINLADNKRLDGMGFAPFAVVLGDGMSVVQQIYSGYGESPEQGAITHQGNAYLNAKFPKLDYIKKATIE